MPGDAVLNWVDAWLLACLTHWRWRWSRPIRLWDLIDTADVLFRGQPTFDDVSFSLPRLISAGYITASRDRNGDLQLKATDAAFDLKARFKDKSHPLSYMPKAVGAPPWQPGSGAQGDRSLGRYPDLDDVEYRRAQDRVNSPRDIHRH